MGNYQESDDIMVTWQALDRADTQRLPIIFNPIVFPGMVAIVLWALILAVIVLVGHWFR